MKRILTTSCLCLCLCLSAFASKPSWAPGKISYESYCGLVMAGYQGWFNTPWDGADRGWYHYTGRNGFRPGSCTIDLWPYTDEYPQLYRTEFVYEDGTAAYLPSAHDASTTDVHFRWMKEYGLDGVFMQRFVTEIARPSGKAHFDTVLEHAMTSANKYDRAICIMYDLSGMPSDGHKLLVKDIKELAKKFKLFDHKANPSYLYHNGKPLVTVWGVGFNDKRKYGLDEAEYIISNLKKLGFSVMLGVPTAWRTLEGDTVPDQRLLALVKECDIVMPWFVGRYNQDTYAAKMHSRIKDDLAWAGENGVDYAPLCFPGFSWDNMQKPGRGSSLIPRNGGSFFKEQLDYCIAAGAKMIYIAMFDEIDEGTAIFKLATHRPVGQKGSMFVPLDEGVEPDTYLKLVGEAAKELKLR